MTKRQTKAKAVKARKTVRKTVKAKSTRKTRTVKTKRAVRARKTVRATKRTVRNAGTVTVFKQPIAALQNGVSSFIGYFK
jgi:hypothetical protein